MGNFDGLHNEINPNPRQNEHESRQFSDSVNVCEIKNVGTTVSGAEGQ